MRQIRTGEMRCLGRPSSPRSECPYRHHRRTRCRSRSREARSPLSPQRLPKLPRGQAPGATRVKRAEASLQAHAQSVLPPQECSSTDHNSLIRNVPRLKLTDIEPRTILCYQACGRRAPTSGAGEHVRPRTEVRGLTRVSDTGIEPATSSVSGKRATAAPIAQAIHVLEVATGFEPVWTALQAAASPLGHATMI